MTDCYFQHCPVLVVVVVAVVIVGVIVVVVVVVIFAGVVMGVELCGDKKKL